MAERKIFPPNKRRTEIKFQYNNKIFNASDNCPIERPPTKVLRKFIKDHGPEAFVTSEKYGQYAACVVGDLLDSGAEIIEETTMVKMEEPAVVLENLETINGDPSPDGANSDSEDVEG